MKDIHYRITNLEGRSFHGITDDMQIMIWNPVEALQWLGPKHQEYWSIVVLHVTY